MGKDQPRTATSSVRGILLDIQRMVELRRDLAEAELQCDLQTARRYGVLLLIAGVFLAGGLAVLIVMLAGLLDGWIDRRGVPWATLGLGAACVLFGSCLAILSRRGFQRELLLLQQTRNELAEDLIWIREWFDESAQEE